MFDLTRDSAFEILDQCRDELKADEAQALVDSIIGLMQEKNITYTCAYNVLNAVREALELMSRRLAL